MTMPGLADLSYEPLLCGACKHETYRHRNNGAPINNVGPDDPVPCWGVIGSTVKNGEAEYEYCGCTTKHTLAQDAARRRRTESTR